MTLCTLKLTDWNIFSELCVQLFTHGMLYLSFIEDDGQKVGRSAGRRGEAGVGQFDKHPASVRFNNQELFGDWGQTTHFMPQLLLNSRLLVVKEKTMLA